MPSNAFDRYYQMGSLSDLVNTPYANKKAQAFKDTSQYVNQVVTDLISGIPGYEEFAEKWQSNPVTGKMTDFLGSVVDPVDPTYTSTSGLEASSGSGNDALIEALNGWFEKLQTSADKANQVAVDNANAAMAFNSREAQLQRDWEENMSNTAYQRAYADMKAAGINPIIGFGAGASPASTPSGASASGSAAQTFKRDKSLIDDILPLVEVFASLLSTVTKAFR